MSLSPYRLTKQLPTQYDSQQQPSSCPKERLANLACPLDKKNLVLIGPQMPLYIRPYLSVQHCFYTFLSNFALQIYTFPSNLAFCTQKTGNNADKTSRQQETTSPVATCLLEIQVFRTHSLLSTLLQGVIIRLSSHDNDIITAW